MLNAPILGLTGGIASGKSAVAKLFVQKGASLIDADQIAHQLMAPGELGAQQIKQVFGAGYFDDNGQLNRAKLGALVFNDPAALQQLNDLTQTLIRQRIVQELDRARQQDYPLIVAEIPLLFEQHYQDLCDAILVVTIDQELQVTRLQQRNQLSTAAAEQRIAAQVMPEVRLAGADFILDGSHDLPALAAQFTKLWQSASFRKFLQRPVRTNLNELKNN